MIFEISFMLSFSIKQSSQTVPTHDQYIHLECCSISPTKEKINVIICKPQRHKKKTMKEAHKKVKKKEEATYFWAKQVAVFSIAMAMFFLSFIHKGATTFFHLIAAGFWKHKAPTFSSLQCTNHTQHG